MDGAARSTFLRNRIGFCVLHPIRECAGARCRLALADGTTRDAAFPRLVAGRNPFVELVGLSHEVTPGVWADLRFEGDVFETEDQRNWIDGSFKTFCTPLRLPFPVEIASGTRVRQAVALTIEGPVGRPERSDGVIALPGSRPTRRYRCRTSGSGSPRTTGRWTRRRSTCYAG